MREQAKKVLFHVLVVFAIAFVMYAQSSAGSSSCGEKFSTRMDQDVSSKHRFRSRVIESQPISMPLECYVKCMKNCRCVSYNVCNGGKLCELNSEKKGNNISLYEANDECDYYEYEFSKQDPSRSCLDKCCSTSNPCLNNGRCQATCMNNGHRFTCQDCPVGIRGNRCEILARSCASYANFPNRPNGEAMKTIYAGDGTPYKVICFFTPTEIRTLVMSFSREKSQIVRPYSLKDNAPLNEDSPNWQLYRLSSSRMKDIKTVSSQWYYTCKFDTESWQSRDSLQVSFHLTNPLVYDITSAGSTCRRVKRVNIGGHECNDCLVGMTQKAGGIFRINNNQVHCGGELSGVTSLSCGNGEPVSYFGYYMCYSTATFKCTDSSTSTTQLWFSD